MAKKSKYKSFTKEEWKLIMEALDKNPGKYGLPIRKYGSVVLGSFNVRKLGTVSKRSKKTWEFLAYVCKHFDLLAVQEIMDNLAGLRYLMNLLGPEFGLIISDTTGAFPGRRGLTERLGFIYNRRIVERTEIATDITYDRSELIKTLALNMDDINPVLERHKKYMIQLAKYQNKEISKKPRKPSKRQLRMPVFLNFIRQPFCTSFRIHGHPGTTPYEFMAVDAHLNYGDPKHDPKQEFYALMDWIVERARQKGKSYYPNFILLGDLNMDFDNPKKDMQRLEKDIKILGKEGKIEGDIEVNFPFFDVHPGQSKVFRTNARLNQTYDQIGLFFRDKRLPTYKDNTTIMGKNSTGPDFGVFNFVKLFSEALGVPKSEMKAFVRRFEHKVSDHMPLWLRLPLP